MNPRSRAYRQILVAAPISFVLFALPIRHARGQAAPEAAQAMTEEKTQTAVAAEKAGAPSELRNAQPDVSAVVDARQAEVSPSSLPTGGDKTGVSSQAIAVPQGSGKLQGMGESFSMQLSTGVGTFSVPFTLPHARGGVQPALALSYSTGAGHGIAGVGWDVSWAYVARQTDRGLPTYDDRAQWHPQQDRFVFGGGQELVPICTVQGTACPGTPDGEVMPAWSNGWQYFRARVEGSYLRFFWSPDHRTWRVQSKTGESLELGVPLDGSNYADSLETDPAHPARIFRWNLARQYDNQGPVPPAGASSPAPVNLVQYRYANVGNLAYLTDIYDTPPAASPGTAPLSAYAHHTRLLYETRPDSTLSFRRGWRVDQTQRLTGVDVASAAFLSAGSRHQVRRYHLAYDPASHVTLLSSVQVEGRCDGSEANAPTEDPQTGALPAATNCPMLPPMTFGYQHVAPFRSDGSPGAADIPGYEGFDERVISMINSPPNSIDEDLADLFDINSDSLPDLVATTPGMDNAFPLYLNGAGGVADAFGASRLGVQGVLGATATSIRLSNDNVAVADIDGDGTIDWLHQPAVRSYAVYTPKHLSTGWSMVGRAVPAAAFQDPHLDLGDDTPDIHVFDANGDGLVDVVRATGTTMQTFFSLGRYPAGDGSFGSATWTGAASAALSLQFVSSCVPLVSTGVPIRFSDSTTRLADLNGDGLTDIVYMQPGDIRYWPGRGDGSWGTAPLGSCSNGFAAKTYLSMASSPHYSDTSGNGLRLDDVNGDGLDDLVQVGQEAIDIWLNVDGTGFTEKEHLIKGVQPAQGPLWQSKVRLVDANGSGTRDILWGEGGRYRYIDLQGGTRPWMLTSIDNGIGKLTQFEYSTSTRLMLAAAAGGQPWQTTAPMPLQVVSRVTDTNNLPVGGQAAQSYVTEYTYADPVYDGRQREFRGFRTATAKRVGDANGPTSTSRSTFLLGECADDEAPPAGLSSRCTPEGRWADNPREALKGLPVVEELFDETGVYASTIHHSYTLRKLYTGLDGREVRAAFESQTDTWQYDTGAFVDSESPIHLADVTLDGVPGPEPSQPVQAFVRAAAGTAHTISESQVDAFGNGTARIAHGCVDGAACPVPDDIITSASKAALVTGDASGWLWRTNESYVVGRDLIERKHNFISYDPNGNPIQTTAALAGTVALDRFFQAADPAIDPATPGSLQVAPVPPNASADGTVTVSQQTYDAFGNKKSQGAANGRCRDVTYASDYADLAIGETLYAGALGAETCAAGGGARGETTLVSIAAYDRGLGVMTQMVDLHGEPFQVAYDGLGRLTALTKPSASSRTLSALPSVLVDYDLATPVRPYSILHTQSLIGANEADGTYRDSFAYVDGLGRTVVSIETADPAAGDGQPWIVQGLTDYDAKAETQRSYLASFWAGDPRAYPLATPAATPHTTQTYDAFGRKAQLYGLDASLTLQNEYHALSLDKRDGEQLRPGPHAGSYTRSTKDGHGREVSTTEYVHASGALEARTLRKDFLSDGAPYRITRTHGQNDDVVRWMVYDTLGRMVLNVEPDAARNFNADPSTAPTALKAWHYAYDDNGDLVGTSDARGCGSNYLYDAAGRIVVEDYSPCQAAHAPYSAPNVATGEGAEVFYRYDRLDPQILAIPGVTPSPSDENAGGGDAGTNASTAVVGTCPVDEALLLGRLVSVSDRASQTVSSFDGRGRLTCTARRIARPDQAGQYTPRWYSQGTRFDGADRPVRESTGAQLLVDGPSRESVVATSYSKRGTVANVGSSYGPLVAGVHHDADGLVLGVTYGDAASTTMTTHYDARRRFSSVQTARGAPTLWSSPPAGYSSPPEATSQLLLEDLDYTYDDADNPIEIRDWRVDSEWPAGAKPVTRQMQYDDSYRLTRIDYRYTSGDDAWVDPFAAEDTGGAQDPRRAQPSPHVGFDKRPLWQSFTYDWLGNARTSDDDAKGFYDRSLGNVTNGTAGAGPYQIRTAAGGAAPRDGALTTRYDDAGNLIGLSVVRDGGAPCLPSGASCSQRFAYAWDEVGRLVRARRWDGGSLGGVTDALPSSSPAADLRYAYDGNDNRVLKTAVDAQANELHTAYVFATLDVRRTTFDGTDYALTQWTEVPYLFAHGVRIGRVHYAATDAPTLSSGGLHVFLELSDHLGSTDATIDRATGELVERGSYQAYGGADSDYRPERWDSFREDYRFTGKEEDIEVGLEYFGKRFLVSPLMRWASPDPLAVHGLGADPNVYAYVHGAVFKAVDPQGLVDVGTGAGASSGAPMGMPPSMLQLPSTSPMSSGTPTLSPGDLRAPVQPGFNPGAGIALNMAGRLTTGAVLSRLEIMQRDLAIGTSRAGGEASFIAGSIATHTTWPNMMFNALSYQMSTAFPELRPVVGSKLGYTDSYEWPDAGSARCPELRQGWYVSLGLTESGAARGVLAFITRSMVTHARLGLHGTGDDPSEDPAGWTGGRDGFYARVHLLGKSLGGPGVAWNLVTGLQSENVKMFNEVERRARAFAASGQTVCYAAIPFYNSPEDTVPSSVFVSFMTSGGYREAYMMNNGIYH